MSDFSKSVTRDELVHRACEYQALGWTLVQGALPHSERAVGARVHAALPEVGQHDAEGQRAGAPGLLGQLQQDVVALEVEVHHLLRLQVLQQGHPAESKAGLYKVYIRQEGLCRRRLRVLWGLSQCVIAPEMGVPTCPGPLHCSKGFEISTHGKGRRASCAL